jgi:hypothetical protein
MLHPLEHHPSFRAVIAAASPIATLANRIDNTSVAVALLIACGDLAHGFASPPGSSERVRSHHRAWIKVKQIDQIVREARLRRLASPEVLNKAQRAVDRADVLISSLPGVLPS